VQGVQLQGSDGAGWQPMNNVWGAAWESTSVPSGSVSFRFVPDQGGEVGSSIVLGFLEVVAADFWNEIG